MSFPRRGLYVITGPAGEDRGLEERVQAAVIGGARVIQYRNKEADAATRLREAGALAALCRKLNVPFVVNDDPELAAETEADGVHLGRDDPDLRSVRRLLGPRAIVGVSCYSDLNRASAAEANGASYLAFGRFFASGTKPHASGAQPEILRVAKQSFRLPVVAIGGITPDNAGLLLTAGADLLAVIQGVWGAPDPVAAARAYSKLFQEPKTP
jgi:thiamine-phosphate pyrophosphorylase